jgi:maltose alpha-D-glucosyltransferase/alpha-amylase
MQWNRGLNGGFSPVDPAKLYLPVIEDPAYNPASVNVQAQQQDPSSLYNLIKRMLSVRKIHPEIEEGTFRWVNTSDGTRIAAYLRQERSDRVLVLNNLSSETVRGKATLPTGIPNAPKVLLGTGSIEIDLTGSSLTYILDGYGYLWVQL